MSLFGELKRRNVFRVAAIYLASSWLVLQAADVLISLIGLPPWLGQLVVGMLAVGFPVALVLSWLFEFTPDGLVRDSADMAESPGRRQRARRLDILVVAVAALVAAIVLAQLLWPARVDPQGETRGAAQPPAATAIAVLPFVNLSPDPEQVYLADGITEEILNLLGNVQGLRVTSRTSVFSLKNTELDLPAIGRKLGVSHIVEGSVRKFGTQVRLTAQLIDVAHDAHLWSETYDRDLADVFAIQSDVAAKIARVLRTAMSTDEQSLIGNRPTDSLAAWQSFIAARNTYLGKVTQDAYTRAMGLLDQALQADPGFGRAHALKAVLLLDQANTPPELEAAKQAAHRALELAPLLGGPHYVLAGAAAYEGLLGEAEQEFRTAISRSPNSAEGRIMYARFLLGAGYLERAFAEAQLAAELDPLSPANFWSAAFIAMTSGHLEAARAFTARSRANGWIGWQPDAIDGGADLQAGDLESAQRHYTAAFPDHAAALELVFKAIRERHIDAETRALLARMGSYGPPGAARWGTEVQAGDLDAAYATAWKYLATLVPDAVSDGTVVPLPDARRVGDRIRGDWWFATGAPFRQDPRFVELMEAVGLMAFWLEHGWPDLCIPDGEGLRCR
jgi:TolB-like protein/tetratricopeptide (TPR) repeat protein